jgi:hypothetical protein
MIDLADFLDGGLVIEIEVLKTDEERAAFPSERAAHRQFQQSNQGAGLLIAAVLGEAGDDVSNDGWKE